MQFWYFEITVIRFTERGGLSFTKAFLLCHKKQNLASYAVFMIVSFGDYLVYV